MARSWRNLANNIAQLARLPSRITSPVAAGFNVLIQKQFAQGSDPYGSPWIPLKPSTIRKKGGDDRILIHTGRLRDETIAVPLQGAGIELISVPYGVYNQTKRMILPSRVDLPIAWQNVIEREWSKAFQRVVT